MNIINDINLINDEMTEISNEYKEILTLIDNQSKIFKKNEKLTKEIMKNNSEYVITINFGGKIYQTFLKNLIKQKNSFFYFDILENFRSEKLFKKYFFFDRNNEFSLLIINFMRTNVLNVKGLTYNELLKLLGELKYFGLWEAYKIVINSLKDIKLLKFTSGPLHNACKTPNPNILNIKGNKGGIAVNSPYYIMFELENETEIKTIDIHGFSLNPSLFAPTNGANAKILVSKDNINFEDVGNIPSTYNQFEIKIELKIKCGKYLKFQHTSYLGIGYLKINSN